MKSAERTNVRFVKEANSERFLMKDRNHVVG